MGLRAESSVGLSEPVFGPSRAVPLYRAEGARALDALAIQDFHIPGLTLMERAGEAGRDPNQSCRREASLTGISPRWTFPSNWNSVQEGQRQES